MAISSSRSLAAPLASSAFFAIVPLRDGLSPHGSYLRITTVAGGGVTYQTTIMGMRRCQAQMMAACQRNVADARRADALDRGIGATGWNSSLGGV